MSQRLLLSILVIALAASACALERTTETIAEYPVDGTVTAGPTCPVVQDPPDAACADRPVDGASIWIRDATGAVYSDLVTDSDGRFAVRLPQGRYTVEPQPVDGLLGTAAPQDFEAGPNQTVDLVVRYDTGIR